MHPSPTITELKDKILSLVVAYPKPCARAARRMTQYRASLLQLAIVCETIGLAYSKQVFDSISPAHWEQMAELLRDHFFTLAPRSAETALRETHSALLVECMAWDSSKSVDDPFAFIKGLAAPARAALLAREDSAEIAFISAFWSQEEMTELLAALAPQKRKQVILHISRLARLPDDAIAQAAARFAARLQAPKAKTKAPPTPPPFKQAPEKVSAEDPVAKAIHRIIAGIDLDLEREIQSFVRIESPELSRRLESIGMTEESRLAVKRAQAELKKQVISDTGETSHVTSEEAQTR